MKSYYRKILLKNIIQVLDNDGDGIGDTLVFLPKEPTNIQFTLTQNIDNMGLYDEYEEPVDIVDFGGIWNTSNTGTNDNPGSGGGGTLNPPGSGGGVTVTDGGIITIKGCTNPTATNYNPNATEDDGSCVFSQVIYGCIDPTATNYNPNATDDDGNCEYENTQYYYYY